MSGRPARFPEHGDCTPLYMATPSGCTGSTSIIPEAARISDRLHQVIVVVQEMVKFAVAPMPAKMDAGHMEGGTDAVGQRNAPEQNGLPCTILPTWG